MCVLKRWSCGVIFLAAAMVLAIGCEHKKKMQIDARLKEASVKAQMETPSEQPDADKVPDPPNRPK